MSNFNDFNPDELVDQKITEDGVTPLTKGDMLAYAYLRSAVEFLKLIDPEGFEQYSIIKGNGSIYGEKTDESRREAYEYAVKRAAEVSVKRYKREFTKPD